jgi:phage recombination protein Bet
MTGQPKNQVQIMAERLSVEPQELHNVVLNTLMPSGKQPTSEQFVSFLAVANEYNLNPMTKEIYAFPTQGGGIQPIVSIDGWLKIINSHPQFDGMVFEDKFDDNDKIHSITCRIHRTDRKHPIEVTEYLSECDKGSQPWKKWPVRMLRHKATIQAARYAFSLSGIVDPDEGERIQESVSEKVVQGEVVENFVSDAMFESSFEQFSSRVASSEDGLDQVVGYLAGKGFSLTEEQKQKLINSNVVEGGE